MKKILPLAVSISLLISCPAFAQEYLGSAALFQRLNEISKTPDNPGSLTPAAAVLRDARKFPAEAATLPPEEAATRWLALVDRFSALNRQQLSSMFQEEENFGGFHALTAALPPPSSWDAIAKAIESRPKETGRKELINQSLRVLAHTLTNDPEARWQDAKILNATLKKTQPDNFDYLSRSLSNAVTQADPDPKHALSLLEEDLAAREKSAEKGGQKSVRQLAMEEAGSQFALEIPDLLTLTDEATATQLLKRALLLPAGSTFQIARGEKTQKLARKLALEMVDKIKTPPWLIVTTLDSLPLIEALEKRFPATGNRVDDNARQQVKTWHMFGLIVANRTAEAVKLAQTLPRPGDANIPTGHALHSSPFASKYTPAIYNFFHELLTQQPELVDYWNALIDLGPQIGKKNDTVTLLRTSIARQDLAPGVQVQLREFLAPALLAADQIEEGVKELRTVIDTPPPADNDLNSQRASMMGNSRSSAAAQLARIGKLTKRQDWIDAGLAAARKADEEDRKKGRFSPEFSQLLIELGHGPEAEQLLIDGIVSATQRKSPQDYGAAQEISQCLSYLLSVYHKAGRTDDVLALLDKAEGWGAADIIDLPSFGAGPSPAFIAASALGAKGRTDEARKLTLAVLNDQSGYDPAYALLIKLGGDDLIGQLDQLAARDRFEERPLIWKAQLQLDAGQFDEAEKTARAAIAIDPSDGEEPKGDRMRVYAVLASILEKKGDAAQAKILRGAVEAIRLSEDADDWREAGLLTRAVQMYQEALTHFADAYCIQSRLALRYAELGLMDKAAEHYRRAYELMPDSFGRIESHCFGCEEAFAGERAQAIAESVFTTLAADPKAKPQVFYLLGYLREQQDRPADALENFTRAVTLDPDYFNAWGKISELSRNTRVPIAQADQAVFNQIRLDPLQRHGQPEINNVADFKTLWQSLADAAKLRPPVPTALYPLPASKAAMDGEQARNQQLRRRMMFYRAQNKAASPGEILSANPIFQAVGNIILESSPY